MAKDSTLSERVWDENKGMSTKPKMTKKKSMKKRILLTVKRGRRITNSVNFERARILDRRSVMKGCIIVNNSKAARC